jgi:hypothetical protein
MRVAGVFNSVQTSTRCNETISILLVDLDNTPKRGAIFSSSPVDRLRELGGPMSTRAAGWAQFATLLLLVAFWCSSPDYETLLLVVVCAAACAVAFLSGEKHRYVLATLSGGIALLFNPVAPVKLSSGAFLWACWASVAMFLCALVLLKHRERVPFSSIADAIKRSESVEAVWAWKQE